MAYTSEGSEASKDVVSPWLPNSPPLGVPEFECVRIGLPDHPRAPVGYPDGSVAEPSPMHHMTPPSLGLAGFVEVFDNAVFTGNVICEEAD
jgi:hypothetical protein